MVCKTFLHNYRHTLWIEQVLQFISKNSVLRKNIEGTPAMLKTINKDCVHVENIYDDSDSMRKFQNYSPHAELFSE